MLHAHLPRNGCNYRVLHLHSFQDQQSLPFNNIVSHFASDLRIQCTSLGSCCKCSSVLQCEFSMRWCLTGKVQDSEKPNVYAHLRFASEPSSFVTMYNCAWHKMEMVRFKSVDRLPPKHWLQSLSWLQRHHCPLVEQDFCLVSAHCKSVCYILHQKE